MFKSFLLNYPSPPSLTKTTLFGSYQQHFLKYAFILFHISTNKYHQNKLNTIYQYFTFATLFTGNMFNTPSNFSQNGLTGHNKNITMLDTHQKLFLEQIQSIRKTGYELTPPTAITMPSQTTSTSLLSSFLLLLNTTSDKKLLFDPKASKKVTILSDKLLLVSQSNKLAVLYYSVVDDKMQVQTRGCFFLASQVQITSCSSAHWFTQIDSCNYSVLQLENCSLCLLAIYDYAPPILLYQTKIDSKVLAIKFVSEKEVLVVTQTGKVVVYLVRNKKLVEHQVEQIKIWRENNGRGSKMEQRDEKIRSAQICMFADRQNQVYIFFTTQNQLNKTARLHLLRYYRTKSTLSGAKIYPKLFQQSVTSDMLISLTIYAYNGAFFVKNNKSLWVVQHKFGTYTRADAVTNLNDIFKMVVIQRENNLFLCSFGKNEIQLCQIEVKEVGCKTKLLDVIECDAGNLAAKELASWIFLSNHRAEIAFLLDKDQRTMELYLTHKGDKLNKLVERVQKVEKQQMSKGQDQQFKWNFYSKLHQIQSLSTRLGYSKSELYLSLWHKNQKNAANMLKYLIQSLDFKTIIHELQQYLHVKTLAISELVKLLKTIQLQILKQLKKQISLQLIQQYLKCNFQKRKLKLYTNERLMDFQQYNRINQMSLMQFIRYSIDLTLFPQKFHHNIMWKDENVDTPLELHYILREFRLAILEDYPAFLIELLQPYQDRLLTVLNHYYYLLPQYPLKISIIRQELVKLSNIYPSDTIIQDHQHFWLGLITQLEWHQEMSSVNYIFSQLFNHYGTSFIQFKLKQFKDGVLYKLGKNKQFILVQSNRQDFQNMLAVISQAKSMLFLCQRVNRRAMDLNIQSQNKGILTLMQQKNKLPHQEYITFLRLSRMQIFLIKNKLLADTTIQQLLDISDIYLVSLFFLGRRVKIPLLFEQFSQLYQNYQQFTLLMKKYVQSQECSKVELQMLVQYIKGLNEEKINKNMDVIGILIEGFLGRVEIRQIDKAKDFYDLFRQLPLRDDLLIKMSVFDSVKSSCYSLLRELGLGKFSYLTVINQIDTVVEAIVRNYFQYLCEKGRSIYIEGVQLPMALPQNIFPLILYLKDKIYSFRQQLQIYLSLGYWLTTWNQFQLISDCFGKGMLVDGNQMLSQQFYQLLVKTVIGRYLQQSQMIYDCDTIQHLNNLLGLLDERDHLRVSEEGKIKFAEILAQLDLQVSLRYMQVIKERWAAGRQERIITFMEIVDTFVDKVDFKTFQQMHHTLESIRLGIVPYSYKNDQMTQLTQYICSCLSSRQKYQELCQIIQFLNQGQNQFIANSSTMIQCFLMVLVNYELQGDRDLEQCRNIVDYYLTSEHDVQTINSMFQNKFRDDQYCQYHHSQIITDRSVVKVNQDVKINRKELWQLILQSLKTKQQSIINSSVVSSRVKSHPRKAMTHRSNSIVHRPATSKYILFCYFFCSKMLEDSSFLFNLNHISFDHCKNAIVITQLCRHNTYKNINFGLLIQSYMKGLFKIYYMMTLNSKKTLLPSQQQDQQQFLQSKKQIQTSAKQIQHFDDDKLMVMIYEMNKDQNNQQIFLSLRKLVNLYKIQSQKNVKEITFALANVGSYISQPKPHHQIIAEQLFKGLQNCINLKESITQQQEEVDEPSKIYKYSKFQQIKNKVMMNSNIISQKRLVQKVLLDLQDDQSSQYTPILQAQTDKKIQIQQIVLDNHSQVESLTLKQLSLMEGGQRYEYEQQEFTQLKKMLINKNFSAILQKYQLKVILRVINDYFYSYQSTTQKQKKTKKPQKLKRAKTLNKAIDFSNNKLMLLIDTIENLKLSQNAFKTKVLRQSLARLSLQDLQFLQPSLLVVFKLNVLLDPTKSVKKIVQNLLLNCRQLKNIDLQSFDKIMQVVQYYHTKCTDDKNRNKYEQWGQFYLVYLKLMMESGQTDEEKMADLQKIVGVLGQQSMLSINDSLLQLFAPHQQLMQEYVILIYTKFGQPQSYPLS